MSWKINLLAMSLIGFSAISYTQVRNSGNLRMHSGSQVGLFGNFTNDGTFDSNSGQLTISGSNPQLFDGTNSIQVQDVLINKSADSLRLTNELQVTGNLSFIKGQIHTNLIDSLTDYVHFLSGASFSGVSDSSFVNGVVRKTGSSSFVFPVGNMGRYRPVSMGAPSVGTDHFTAFYRYESPDALYSVSSVDTSLHHVSQCEYWGLSRTGGTSDVPVTLSWDSNSCGVSVLCDLRVAHWLGTEWTSHGNGGTTGNVTSGTIETGGNCTTPVASSRFGIFTLSSATSENVLPATLVSFTAVPVDRSVALNWITVTEENVDRFDLFKSADGIEWTFLTEVDAVGNSSAINSYESWDDSPMTGTSYYLLQVVDTDGEVKNTEVRSVNFTETFDEWLVYPNPALEVITLSGLGVSEAELSVFDAFGRDCSAQIHKIYQAGTVVKMDISALSSGLYVIRGERGFVRFRKL